MKEDHKRQRANSLKMIEHLEIAKSYCELMYTCAANVPDNALLADVEPHNIQKIIDDAKFQLNLIGAEWESIETSVIPSKEF